MTALDLKGEDLTLTTALKVKFTLIFDSSNFAAKIVALPQPTSSEPSVQSGSLSQRKLRAMHGGEEAFVSH